MSAAHITAGDQLQSAASRLVEFVLSCPSDTVPYEIHMAAFEARAAVREWTDARRGDR